MYHHMAIVMVHRMKLELLMLRWLGMHGSRLNAALGKLLWFILLDFLVKSLGIFSGIWRGVNTESYNFNVGWNFFQRITCLTLLLCTNLSPFNQDILNPLTNFPPNIMNSHKPATLLHSAATLSQSQGKRNSIQIRKIILYRKGKIKGSCIHIWYS